MALDEPQENDVTYTDHGVTFTIEKDLLEQIKPVRVDFVESAEGSGFHLASSLAAGGGCGSSCDC
jgi:Fe-S cluster assembly iron-binding protein IscA